MPSPWRVSVSETGLGVDAHPHGLYLIAGLCRRPPSLAATRVHAHHRHVGTLALGLRQLLSPEGVLGRKSVERDLDFVRILDHPRLTLVDLVADLQSHARIGFHIRVPDLVGPLASLIIESRYIELVAPKTFL